LRDNPAMAREIEQLLRGSAGLISDKLLDGEPEPDAEGDAAEFA
jgi:recombination protein RecA